MTAKQLITAHQNLMDQMFRKTKDSPFSDRNYYAVWLSQFYYFVSHATRMLTAAASRVPPSQDDLHMRFLKHAGEETHHELYIVEDLKNLGFDINDMPEMAITSQMYQSQYYFINYKSPASVLGGVLYLEGLSLSTGKYIYNVCSKVFGEECCRFVKSHSLEDEDHMDEAMGQLENLSSQELANIAENMHQMASLYDIMTDKVLEEAGRSVRKLKAA